MKKKFNYKEYQRIYQQKYRKKNRKQEAKRMQAYRDANPKLISQSQAKYRQKNRMALAIYALLMNRFN